MKIDCREVFLCSSSFFLLLGVGELFLLVLVEFVHEIEKKTSTQSHSLRSDAIAIVKLRAIFVKPYKLGLSSPLTISCVDMLVANLEQQVEEEE